MPAALNPFGEIIQGSNGRVPTPSLEAKESIRAFLYSVNKAKAYQIARVQVATWNQNTFFPANVDETNH